MKGISLEELEIVELPERNTTIVLVTDLMSQVSDTIGSLPDPILSAYREAITAVFSRNYG